VCLLSNGFVRASTIPAVPQGPPPATRAPTSAAHQRAVYLKVYEGERLTARDNTLLGTLALRGLTDGPAGTAKVGPTPHQTLGRTIVLG